MNEIEFEIWNDDAPVITNDGNGDFNFWFNDAPLLDLDTPSSTTTNERKRAFIF